MGFQAKIKRLQAYSFCLIWPISAIVVSIGTYRAMIWSFGGHEAFRYFVLKEPLAKEWHTSNINAMLGRETPLSDVPKYLSTPGHGQIGVEHPHQRNY
jgi:hypothetical protein